MLRDVSCRGHTSQQQRRVSPHTGCRGTATTASPAWGLEIVHSMGLLHQDIHSSNVALYHCQSPLVHDTVCFTGQQQLQQQQQQQPQSLLYDYGLMSADLIECTAPTCVTTATVRTLGSAGAGTSRSKGAAPSRAMCTSLRKS